VHDFGGPIALPLVLDAPGRVTRLVVLNSWMWSFADDAEMVRKGKIAGGRLGRFLYRYANFSLRVLTPYAFADRSKLTRRIHAQYLEPFRDLDSRNRVLWPLARAILGSSQHYDSLWRQRDKLGDLPSLIIWGTKDPAFHPKLLTRWRAVLPQAAIVELPVGHWPQEEAPDRVVDALSGFLDSCYRPNLPPNASRTDNKVGGAARAGGGGIVGRDGGDGSGGRIWRSTDSIGESG